MQFTQNGLEAEVVSREDSTGRKLFLIQEDKQMCHIDQEQVPTSHGKEYANQHGYAVYTTVRAAINGRANGHHVLSVREADVAARQKVNLRSSFIEAALQSELFCYMMEGQPGVDSTGKPGRDLWYYRKRWNDGVDWRNESKARASQESIDTAEALMGKIFETIAKDFKLPFWREEIVDGFDYELLKPEYLTWKQFEAERKNPKTLTKPKI